MATDMMMPRMPGAQQQLGYFFQPPAQTTLTLHTPQISPRSPRSSSGNASPTSANGDMKRPERPPLYIPAVLRPTQYPSKMAPQPVDTAAAVVDDEHPQRSPTSFMSLPGLVALGLSSRRSTGDSAKRIDGNWNFDAFPQPTGEPTRNHWKPDSESSLCDHATCKRHFTYFTRRHHCRRCGNIFCDYHSSFEIPLDQDANFNPRGALSRSCAYCYGQFKEWRSRKNSQSSEASSQDSAASSASSDASVATPIASSPAAMVAAGRKFVTDVAMSVPRDWNWSTF